MGATHSDTNVYRPFGQFPNHLAGLLGSQQLRPLLEGLGIGGGAHVLQGKTGPLADFIRQVQAFAPNVIGQAQGIGNQVAGQSQLDYNTLRGQIDSSLKNLPNYQAASNQGLDYAKQSAADAFSPIRQSALFQQTAQNTLDPLRQSQAARGFESQGGAQQQEQNVLQNLGLNFAQNQQSNQQQAIQGLQGAAGNAAGLNSAGIGIAGQYAPALQNLQSGLSQQYLSPLQGAGGLLSLLTAGQTPGIQLTGATSPQLGTSSKGGGFWGCLHADVQIATPTGTMAVSTISVGDMVKSLDCEGLIITARVSGIASTDRAPHDYALCPSGMLISPTHPDAEGRLIGDRFVDRHSVSQTTTHDLIVDSPTGYYCVVGVGWMRSTIDVRHHLSEAA